MTCLLLTGPRSEEIRMATSDILFYHKHKTHTHTWPAHTNACLYTHPKPEKAPLLNAVKSPSASLYHRAVPGQQRGQQE